ITANCVVQLYPTSNNFVVHFIVSKFLVFYFIFFFFNAPATTDLYTLSLHDALPILSSPARHIRNCCTPSGSPAGSLSNSVARAGDRKSTRLNSSHLGISYAVFCLKKKKKIKKQKKTKTINNTHINYNPTP